jgi:hypothetical protein
MVGKTLIFIGIILIITGAILIYYPKLFSWFGSLPGDIRIERENSRLIIPIGSMILISIILTVFFNVIGLIISRIR